MSNKHLKMLLVEDLEDDAVLITRKLQKEGYRFDFKRVDNEKDFKRAMEDKDWDLIISDYVLPNFSGRKVLELIRREGYDMPLILVSGKIGEETAVDMLKEGASDFVMKDNLFRLPSAVERALSEARILREKRETEEELRKVANRYHLLAENISDIIWTMDANKRFTFVSPSVFDVTGYTIKEIMIKGLDELFMPAYQKKAKASIDQILTSLKSKKSDPPIEDTFEAELICKDGSLIWTETKVAILFEPGKKILGFLGVTRDISERKGIEQERLNLAEAVEQLEEGIIVTDAGRRIRFVNQAFKSVSGFESKEVIGEPVEIIWKGEKDKDLLENNKKIFRRARFWKGRLVRCKKDGTQYEAHILLSPLRDKQGKITSYIIVERDITEEMELEEQFRRMQKMEALGTLAGGVAHDFNNILMPIIINAELLLWETSRENPMRTYLEQTLEAAHRGRDLVKQILIYSRQREVEKKPLDMVQTIKEILRFLRASLPSNIQIQQSFSVDSCQVNADAIQIQQVLMNIFKNAADAIGSNDGRIEISLIETEVGPDDRTLFPGLEPGPYLNVSIRDTGCGMERGTAARIFDPFFTTKKPRKGTGMGLAVAQRIIKNHKGDIRFSTEPGKGSIFYIHLPKTGANQLRQESVDESIPGGEENILLVEDEKEVMLSMKRLLERLGYKVTELTRASEAVGLLRKQKGTFDLIIADQTMPEMRGLELAQELKRIRSDTPVILMTGFVESINPQKVRDLGIKKLMLKPIDSRDMAQTIRKVLDGAT
ncbi:MAG: response regulator [Candidatus Aminicenantes bacterium]|jgi:PAS domain S-box-containing protein